MEYWFCIREQYECIICVILFNYYSVFCGIYYYFYFINEEFEVYRGLTLFSKCFRFLKVYSFFIIKLLVENIVFLVILDQKKGCVNLIQYFCCLKNERKKYLVG